jgi:hypothetical protein
MRDLEKSEYTKCEGETEGGIMNLKLHLVLLGEVFLEIQNRRGWMNSVLL